MKYCPRCQQDKHDSDFYRNPKTEKLGSFCRECKIVWERERRAAHREAYRVYAKNYQKRNPEKALEAQRKWRSKNRDHVNELHKKWADKNRLVYEANRRQKVREAVFNAYGGFRCACCDESEPMFLTIDHVNNDGAEHRKKLKSKIGKSGTAFFDWLKRNNFPSGFQVLCRNCNWGKHVNHGTCPHNNKS